MCHLFIFPHGELTLSLSTLQVPLLVDFVDVSGVLIRSDLTEHVYTKEGS